VLRPFTVPSVGPVFRLDGLGGGGGWWHDADAGSDRHLPPLPLNRAHTHRI